MDNPTLSRKTEAQQVLSDDAKKLFQVIYNSQNKKTVDEDIPRIKVSSFLSKMAFYYEKIRNSVDYKEDHLLRKNAVERILKREIIIEGSLKKIDSEKISKNILTELIRAGYLPNDSLPEFKIAEIGVVIEKYIKTLDTFEALAIRGSNRKNESTNWIIAMAACDIEERLRNNEIIDTQIKQIYALLINNLKLPENSIYEKDKKIQIYVSIHRKLLKFDDWMLSFILFKYLIPNWSEADDKLIKTIAENLVKIRESVSKQVDHPIKGQLDRIISRYSVFFNILTDAIAEDPNGAYKKAKTNHKEFATNIKKICEKKYAQARSKLWRAALRSILYIFITKSVFVVLFEIPISKWLNQEVTPISLVINIGFPALLLFLIVLFSHVPSSDNTKKIVSGIDEILFLEKRNTRVYTLRQPGKRGAFMNTMFGIIYTITFFASFGVIIWGLTKINFNFISISIFLFFLAFVSFFGIRIRKSINELRVLESKDSIFSFFIDFFYMPIISTGKFLSEKFARVNLFVFILDFIIEAPFKTFVEIAEEWAKYVKERREEIV